MSRTKSARPPAPRVASPHPGRNFSATKGTSSVTMRGPETVAAGPPSPEELIRRRDELMAKQRERDRLRREEEERQRAHTVKVGARRPGRW